METFLHSEETGPGKNEKTGKSLSERIGIVLRGGRESLARTGEC